MGRRRRQRTYRPSHGNKGARRVWAHVCDGGSVAVAFLDEVRTEVVAARVHRCQPTQAGAFSTRKEEGLGINIRATSKPASGNKRSTSG